MRYNRQGHNIVHRGLAKKTFKENSIKAFNFCFKKNYGIETDLHTTLDNKIVCYHDFSLKRFKSKKLIKNLKYKDINKIASKYKMHIPTLNEVIKISKKNYLMLEIKSKFTKKNFLNLIPIIKRLKHYSITSFNEKNISNLNKIKKNLNLGLVFSSTTSIKLILQKSKLKYLRLLVLEKKFLTNKKLIKIKKPIYFYTLKDKKVRTKFLGKNLIVENL